jgi:transcriptional regulator with XRE-family HTH domain
MSVRGSDLSPSARKPQNPERDQKICFLREEEGLTFRAIGKIVGLSRQRVGKILEREGVSITFPRWNEPDWAVIDKAIRYRRGGWTLKEIAKEFDLSEGTIFKYTNGRF